MMDGQEKSKKLCMLKIFQKLFDIFFWLFLCPLEEFLRHFLRKTRKKIKFLFYVKNFAHFFFQHFFCFFEVCSSSDLVKFLKVSSSGVLEVVLILTIS